METVTLYISKIKCRGLPDLKKCPKLLESLLTDSHPQAPNLVKKIRNKNSALAFAPMFLFRQTGDLTASESTVWCNTVCVFSVCKNSPNQAYVDLYFVDSAKATELRLHNQANAGCERWLRLSLDTMLCEVNPYAFLYKSMRQVFEGEQQKPYLRIENSSLFQ